MVILEIQVKRKGIIRDENNKQMFNNYQYPIASHDINSNGG